MGNDTFVIEKSKKMPKNKDFFSPKNNKKKK